MSVRWMMAPRSVISIPGYHMVQGPGASAHKARLPGMDLRNVLKEGNERQDRSDRAVVTVDVVVGGPVY